MYNQDEIYDEYEFVDLADEMEFEGEFAEEDEEMAEELVMVQDEEELDQFLGKLFRKAVGGARKFWGSRQGRNVRRDLGKGLRGLGRKMLPSIGRNIGGYVCGRRGRALGNRAGQWFSDAFRFELEYLSPDEQELEIAKKVIKVSKAAIRNAARVAKAKRNTSRAIAKIALNMAAKKHLGAMGKKLVNSQRSGKWVRKGNKIVLLGV